MDFFCMKCKKKVIVADSDVTSEVRSNRKLLRAKCPNCGTKMAKFGKMN
jgi:DNA-directed RNA polymerase subunit RPC12/RpoP